MTYRKSRSKPLLINIELRNRSLDLGQIETYDLTEIGVENPVTLEFLKGDQAVERIGGFGLRLLSPGW